MITYKQLKSENARRTYEKYRNFYDNPVIQELSDIPRWTVSDEDKMPVSINSLLQHYQYSSTYGDGKGGKRNYYGASSRKPEDMVRLIRLLNIMPKAPNNAFYLDNDHTYVVLDIEPKASAEQKRQFMALPWKYAEVSMSGHGIHLIIDYPTRLFQAYPQANRPTLKSPDSTFELHVAHWITFTRNVIARDDTWGTQDPIKLLRPLFEAQSRTVSTSVLDTTLIENPDEEIPHFAEMMTDIKRIMATYTKTPTSFENDWSRYDFSVATKMVRGLAFISATEKRYLLPELTYEQIASTIYYGLDWYMTASGHDRKKHHELRNGNPFLYVRACSATDAWLEGTDIKLREESENTDG